MATEAPQPPSPPEAPHEPPSIATPPKPPVKRSWRRKYRKMRLRFDDAMAESNALMLHEWKAMGTARRLQENNDQVLELLLDFNDQPRVAARLRYDLRALSAADTAVPSSEPTAAHIPATGRHAAHTLAVLEAAVPHTTRADLPPAPMDGLDLTPHAPGYLSPNHEEEYLLATDAVLNEPGFDPALQNGRPIRLSSAHPPLGEKDLTVRNPDSVYNWLRKHQPQVFLQDKDAAAAQHAENLSEKGAQKSSSATTGSKKAKRESNVAAGRTATPAPRDTINEDEDSMPAVHDHTAKARRRTGGGAAADDDTAYRPKGGSSRPTKRKREEGDTPGGKTVAKKKSRASAVAGGGGGGGANNTPAG